MKPFDIFSLRLLVCLFSFLNMSLFSGAISCSRFRWIISCPCLPFDFEMIVICIILKEFAGIKEKRLCIQVEFVPESISFLLFIFAKEGYKPKSHPITFILMGKGVVVPTHFRTLENENHVCQEVRREIWIYSKKTDHADSFTLTISTEVCSITEFEGGKNPRMLSYICNM